MAQFVSKELPDHLFKILNGEDIESRSNKVVQMVTVDRKGWPEAGMLGYQDLLTKDKSNIRLASWRTGACSRNMRRNGKLALLVIDKGICYYVKGDVKPLRGGGQLIDTDHNGKPVPLALFNMRVREVWEDLLPTAKITGGVTYEGSEAESTAHNAIFKILKDA